MGISDFELRISDWGFRISECPLAPLLPRSLAPLLLSPPQGEGVHDGLEQDDDVQPEGLVLDVVEVVLEFEEGVWGISDFELRIANCEFSNPKSQIVESGFVVVEHEELAGGEGEDLAAELGATRYRLSPSTFTSTGSVQG
jgi:hypothetical protein